MSNFPFPIPFHLISPWVVSGLSFKTNAMPFYAKTAHEKACEYDPNNTSACKLAAHDKEDKREGIIALAVGLTLGSIILFGLIAACIFCYVRGRRASRASSSESPAPAPPVDRMNEHGPNIISSVSFKDALRMGEESASTLDSSGASTPSQPEMETESEAVVNSGGFFCC